MRRWDDGEDDDDDEDAGKYNEKDRLVLGFWILNFRVGFGQCNNLTCSLVVHCIVYTAYTVHRYKGIQSIEMP